MADYGTMRTKSAQTNIETMTRIPRQGLLGYNKDHLMLRVVTVDVTREIRVGRSTPDCLFFGGLGNGGNGESPGDSPFRANLKSGSRRGWSCEFCLSSLAGPTPSPSESASRRPRSPSRARAGGRRPGPRGGFNEGAGAAGPGGQSSGTAATTLRRDCH